MSGIFEDDSQIILGYDKSGMYLRFVVTAVKKHDNCFCKGSVCVFEIVEFPGLNADEKLMLNQYEHIERLADK